MTGMAKDLLHDVFLGHSTLTDRVVAIAVSLSVLIAFIAMMLLTFDLIDSAAITPTKSGVATIQKKEIVPAHAVTTFVIGWKAFIPVTTMRPDAYVIYLSIDDKEVSTPVEKTFFDSVKTGEEIQVRYGLSRLRCSYQIAEVSTLR